MRHTRIILGVLVAAVMTAGLGAGAVAQTPAPYVKVFVDNQPIYFDVPPVIASGRVLVPLRGVFERLGAVVAWDAGSQTVLAQRSDTSVSLRIGSTQAMVNGQPAYLDVPALLVSGRTMVPLRFVSQALGAQVAWDAVTTTVQITSQTGFAVPPAQTFPPSQSFPPAQTFPPAPQPVPTTTTITGTVLQVNAGTYPGQITIQTGNAVYTYQVLSTTAISRTNLTTGAGGSVSLSAIQPGDVVQITANQNGAAQSIQATYTQAQASGITSVTVSPSGRQLVAGDMITVVAVGPARGVGTFAIQGLRAGLPMTEQPNQPGTFIGTYTVQPGDYIQGAPVIVQITAPSGQVFTANATTTLLINARAAVLPYQGAAPTITSPTSGATVGVPFTVTGRAVPGTMVKISVDYTGTILFIPVSGSLGGSPQTVTANQNGNWSATFSQEPLVRGGVKLTITAVAVDGNGNAISQQSTVTATLQ